MYMTYPHINPANTIKEVGGMQLYNANNWDRFNLDIRNDESGAV